MNYYYFINVSDMCGRIRTSAGKSQKPIENIAQIGSFPCQFGRFLFGE